METPSRPLFTRESTIRRDAFGRWFHEGEPVQNEAIARAFDRWVDRAEDGRYRLNNGYDWVYVEIEGAPLFVESVEVDEAGVLLELSDGTEEPLDAGTLRQDDQGALFCDARGGMLAAQLRRSAQVMLTPLVDEDAEGPYLRIGGRKVRPPVLSDPLAPR